MKEREEGKKKRREGRKKIRGKIKRNKEEKRKKGRHLLQLSLESGWIGHVYFTRWTPLSGGDYLAYTVPLSLCPYPVVTL